MRVLVGMPYFGEVSMHAAAAQAECNQNPEHIAERERRLSIGFGKMRKESAGDRKQKI